MLHVRANTHGHLASAVFRSQIAFPIAGAIAAPTSVYRTPQASKPIDQPASHAHEGATAFRALAIWAAYEDFIPRRTKAIRSGDMRTCEGGVAPPDSQA